MMLTIFPWPYPGFTPPAPDCPVCGALMVKTPTPANAVPKILEKGWGCLSCGKYIPDWSSGYLVYGLRRWGWSRASLWYLKRDMDQDRREHNLANIRHADDVASRLAVDNNLTGSQYTALKGLLRAFWLQ